MEQNDLLISYYRLSKDDPERDESSSIYYQREIISKYIQSHPDLAALKREEYSDDGFSGTTLERPDIQKVLELVKKGRVKCIIVKDISRFSRDYIDIGKYLEKIFPFMDVRFISIGDDYDSNDYIGKSLELDMKFKSILADYYCKDTSQKIIDQLDAKKSQGKFIAGSTPFGYSKSKSDKYQLVVEQREADIVKRIFDYAADGYSVVEIAKKLNESDIPTPLMFQKMKKKIERESEYGKYIWSGKSVHNILTNEAYVGTMVYGKYQQVAVSSKRKLLLPSSQWKRIYNHHEPIIEQELFDTVQERYSTAVGMQTREKKYQRSEEFPLLGKLYCGGCKRTLFFNKGKRGKHLLACRTKDVTFEYECYDERQTYEEVQEVVLYQLKKRIKQELKVSCITIAERHQFEKQIESLEKDREETQTVIDLVEEQIQDLLIQYHRKKISQTDFLKQKSIYDAKLLSGQKYLDEVSGKISEYRQAIISSDNMKDEVESYGDLEHLTRELVTRYIDKVFLYKESCKMEIVWK